MRELDADILNGEQHTFYGKLVFELNYRHYNLREYFGVDTISISLYGCLQHTAYSTMQTITPENAQRIFSFSKIKQKWRYCVFFH